MKQQRQFTAAPFGWTALLICLLTPVFLELVLHLFIYGTVSLRVVYLLLFGLAAGALGFGICCALPRKAAPTVLWVLVALVTLYFEIHLVYNSIFGEFMSIMQLFTGAAAVTNFFGQMLHGIWQCLPKMLVLLVPLVITIVLLCMKKVVFPAVHWLRPLAAVAVCAALHFGAIGIMMLRGTGAYTVYGLYTSRNTGTEISVNNIGLLPTTRLECKYMLLGALEGDQSLREYAAQSLGVLNPDWEYNMLDLDFEALKASTQDPALRQLDDYFAAEMPTEKHEYTGLLEGYNLITICAESFSTELIDPVRTPTLYKLANGGFIFKNFFGTYGSNTTNGEYTFCMGNYPDMSRSKAAASFFASQFNSLPYCLGNQFEKLGYQTWAYHNYSGEYYSRRDTHPNMGYTFQAAGSGLEIEINWPSSDLEMVQASAPDFLSSDQPFHVYYMTFSGHYQYDWANPMSLKNKAMTEDLPYSETVKAYIACNQELEYALTELMEQLEQAGVADKTVIVLTNDHFPYGLTDQQFSELAGHTVDTTFEKYRNSFICYVPDMEPVTVDTYCSTVDILPTLSNLFGLTYDSRLLAGRDVLSEGAYDMAVLSDESFVTRDYGFDAATGQVRIFTEGYEVDEADLLRRQGIIQNQFRVSLDVLNHDYFAHAIADDQSEEEEPGKTLPFTDIPEGKSTDCLEFLWGNGYIDAASETKFGYEATATYAEFLDVLYRMAGNPNMGSIWVYLGSSRQMTGKYLPAVKWAAHNKLLNVYPENMNSYRPLKRNDMAVTLMKYGASLGLSTEVDDEELLKQMTAQHPELTAEECRALHWCYNHLILTGSGGKILTIMDDNPSLKRYDMARVIYNFWLYALQGS